MREDFNFENIQVKGTVVSLYPKNVSDQYKPDLVPPSYTILAGDPVTKKLGLTHINSCRRRVYVGEDRGGMQSVLVPASEVCTSLVNDFIGSCIYVGENMKPAIFWVPGLLNESEVNKQYSKEIESALNYQMNWFKNLVSKGDEMWSRVKNPRAISDIQKYAANFLKVERDWVLDQEINKNLSICPVCTAKVSPTALVCMNCKEVLRPKEYEEYKKRTGKVA